MAIWQCSSSKFGRELKEFQAIIFNFKNKYSLTCNDGEFVSSSKCQYCPIHCKTCSASNTCDVCESGFYLDKATNGCIRQEVDNCIEIDAAATKVCQKCADTYWLKSTDHSCVKQTLTVCATWKQSVAAEACQTCATGYWLKSDGICTVNSKTGCKTWTQNVATETCEAAADGYFLVDSATLKDCTTLHAQCSVCTGTACTHCKSGYYLAADDSCLAKTKKCTTWTKSATESCSDCPDGYEVQEGECYATGCLSQKCGGGKARSSQPVCDDACNDAHCEDCTNQSADQCLECKTDYELIAGACYAVIANCKNYIQSGDDKGKCNECNDKFWLAADKLSCTGFITNCKANTEDSALKCTTCEDGYWLAADKLSCTTACGVSGCKVCSGEDAASKCTTCNDKFWLAVDKLSCTGFITNCKVNTEDSALKCTTCEDGYWLAADKLSCTTACGVSDCKVCQEDAADKCTTCDDKFWLAADNSACTAFITNCKVNTEDSALKCTTCEDGYWLAADKLSCTTACGVSDCKVCQEDAADKCTTCDDKFWLAADNSACTGFITNCKVNTEDSALKCTTCEDGYWLAADKTACTTACGDTNCKVCSGEDAANKCTTCKDGYTKTTDKKCVLNSEVMAHCTTLATPTLCEVCEDGYYLAQAKHDNNTVYTAICVSCATYKKYTGESACGYEDGWRKFPFLCQDLSAGCIKSDPIPIIGVAAEDCMTCAPKYKLDATNKSCVQCPSKCISCQGANACDGCEDGYYLNSTSKACTQCDATTCSQCDESKCTDCKPNYRFQIGDSDDKTKCAACPENCSRCYDNSTCIQCKAAFYLKTEGTGATATITCPACSAGCNDCDDTTKCYSCKGGYYLNSTTCKECVDHCTSCKNGTSCETCETNYEWDSESKTCVKKTTSSSDSTGTECQSITDCISCKASDSSKCALCASGSVPVNNACSCGDDELLINGACTKQESEMADDVSEKTLAECSALITAAKGNSDKKAENTKKLLERAKTILSGDKTAANAKLALQMLVQLADTATDEDAQTAYKTIITDSCSVDGLDEIQFQVAFTAADKLMKSASDPKAIYDAGFSTCLTNLLKQGDISDVLPMKLENGEFTMRKFKKADGAKSFELTGIKITANADFMDCIESSDDLFACVQFINKDANPFKNESTNSVTLSSKIVSMTVMSSGSSAAKQTVKLATDKSFPIQFDAAGSGAKCGYYDTTDKKWVEEGDLDSKTCNFTHLTDFAIFTTSDGTDNDDDNAYLLQAFSMLLVFIIALF